MFVGKKTLLADVRDVIIIGAALPFQVRDSLGRLLLSQGQVVASEAQMEALLERGAWAEYEEVQRVRLEGHSGKAAVAPAAPQRPSSVFDRWEKQVGELDGLLRKVSRNLPVAAELEAFTSGFMVLLDRDADVALFMAVRHDERRFATYAQTHGLHTATLAVLTSRQMGLAAAGQLALARAALTMNVAMLELQALMAEQDTPPTQRQMEAIRSHPERSVQLLRGCGVTDEDWLNIVLDHHERSGGGGYPRGLAEVSDPVRVLRAADVFASKISARALRPALTPQHAARDLFQQEPGSPVATALIKAVGVHPPGELVQLHSGEVAIVTRRAVKGPAPVVACLSNRNGQPVVDTAVRDTAQPEFAITGPCVDRARFSKVLPERVYGLMMV